MYLLEHDAKELLAAHGIPVPEGCLLDAVTDLNDLSLPPGPWIVKGQIAAGGRGKAGIISKAATPDEVRETTRWMFGMVVKTKRVESVRVEQQVSAADELYIGMLIDAAAGGVRILVSERGGVDIEALPREAIRSETVRAERDAMMTP